jgi:hypothetical protein
MENSIVWKFCNNASVLSLANAGAVGAALLQFAQSRLYAGVESGIVHAFDYREMKEEVSKKGGKRGFRYNLTYFCKTAY